MQPPFKGRASRIRHAIEIAQAEWKAIDRTITEIAEAAGVCPLTLVRHLGPRQRTPGKPSRAAILIAKGYLR